MPFSGCGDEQRLSRSGDEDDTRSTGSGLGSLRPEDDTARDERRRPNEPRNGERNSAAGV